MHWPTDLVGGALLGLVWLVVTTRLLAPGPGHRRGPSSG
jgi:membrane-associated phospholipid phosphatase